MILNDVDFAKFMALNYSLWENNDYIIIDEFFKNSFETICYELSRLNFYKCKVIYDNDKEIIYIKIKIILYQIILIFIWNMVILKKFLIIQI